MNPRLLELERYDAAAAAAAADRADRRRAILAALRRRLLDPLLSTLAVLAWGAAAVLLTLGLLCMLDENGLSLL